MKLAFLHGFLLFSLILSAGAGAAVHPAVGLCRLIYEENDAQETFAEAYALYPENPIRRAIYLQEKHGDVAVPFRLVEGGPPREVGFRNDRKETIHPLDALEAANTGGVRTDIQPYVDLELNSVRYASPADMRKISKEPFVIPGDSPIRLRNMAFVPMKESKIIVDVTHGWSAVFSNSARVYVQMAVFNGTKAGKRHQLSIGGNVMPVSAVAIDRPFHGPSTCDMKYFGLEGSLQWRKRYYETLKAHNLPVVPMTRSGENVLAAQLAFQHPELFNGMIWTNPMHMKEGLVDALNGTRTAYSEDRSPVNGTAMRWVTNVFEEMLSLPPSQQWWESRSGMPDVPILIIVGEHDLEVSQATRAHYRRMARENPKVFYVEVPGASHDVFSITEDAKGTGESGQRYSPAAEARAIGSWQYVYWFLQSQVLKNEAAPEPTQGWMIK